MRSGKILDIGCGTTPNFLSTIRFDEKFGLDKVVKDDVIEAYHREHKINLIRHDFEVGSRLPFEDITFEAVTMLAVFEHIEATSLLNLLGEIHRVLRNQGVLVLTTPAWWTDPILKTLSVLHLVSREEIDEHKDAYSHSDISSLLQKAGFCKDQIRLGYFELFMNNWGVATK